MEAKSSVFWVKDSHRYNVLMQAELTDNGRQYYSPVYFPGVKELMDGGNILW